MFSNWKLDHQGKPSGFQAKKRYNPWHIDLVKAKDLESGRGVIEFKYPANDNLWSWEAICTDMQIVSERQ
jgi:hypothetical protein